MKNDEQKEEHVVQKRSKFRAFKKLLKEVYLIHLESSFGKRQYRRSAIDKSGRKLLLYKSCMEALSEANQKLFVGLAERCFKCSSFEYMLMLKKNGEKDLEYFPEIGDVCYFFSKVVRQSFFESDIRCFLFKLFTLIYDLEGGALDLSYESSAKSVN